MARSTPAQNPRGAARYSFSGGNVIFLKHPVVGAQLRKVIDPAVRVNRKFAFVQKLALIFHRFQIIIKNFILPLYALESMSV
jgi:hypothetical protein